VSAVKIEIFRAVFVPYFAAFGTDRLNIPEGINIK
jgi:hypothetical protein